MARAKRPWQQRAQTYFEASAQRVFTRDQLGMVFADEAESLGTPASLSFARFLDFLIASEMLRVVKVKPKLSEARVDRAIHAIVERQRHIGRQVRDDEEVPVPGDPVAYRTFTRYIWGPSTASTPYELALSLRSGSYLSHASAVFLHGLTTQIPRTVYANREQSPKPPPKGPLTQAGINQAFRRPPRVSNYVYAFEDTSYVLLSGKASGNLEVSEIALDDATSLRSTTGATPRRAPLDMRVTKIERTLIDVTVRPTYAGGVFQVLAAFRAARGRASLATLAATLRRLQYVYPYHQLLGFYLTQAGYPTAQLERFRAPGLTFDFPLANQLPDPQYDPTWRVYYPAGLINDPADGIALGIIPAS